MGRVGLVTIVVVVQVALGVSGACATADDRASTAALLRDGLRFLRAGVGGRAKSQAALSALAAEASASCSQALANAPSTATPRQRDVIDGFTVEMSLEAGYAWLAPFRTSGERLLGELRQLRWTDVRIRRRVKEYVESNDEGLAIKPPDPCTQARLVAASGFTAFPPDGRQFVVRVIAAGSDVTLADLARLTTRFQNARGRRLARRVERLQAITGAFGRSSLPTATARLLRAMGFTGPIPRTLVSG